MFWSTILRRFWWLLPVAIIGLLGIGFLMRAPKPSATPVAVAPPPHTIPHVRGVVNSPLGSEEHIVAMGDFNGDGRQDLALTNGDHDMDWGLPTDPQGTVTLWLGDGHGGLRHGPMLRDTEATLLAALDADGDGDDDLLAGSFNDDSLVLWRNDGRGQRVAEFIPSAWGVEDLATGDVDGDGDPDLVIPHGSWLEVGHNDGQGHFQWHEQDLRPGPPTGDSNDLFTRVALVDVDGDHDLDLVSPRNQASILFNDSHGHFGHEQRLPGYTGYSLAIGDLNGDARPDLVLDIGGGKMGVFLNDGTGHFGADSLAQTLGQPQSGESCWVALGDTDHDGDVDLVFNFGEDVWVRRNDGQAHFEPAYHVPTPFSGLKELSLADLDRDGWLDLLAPIPVAPARPGPSAGGGLTSLRPPTGDEYYAEADQLPTAVGGGPVQAVVEAALQKRLVVPHGYTIVPTRPPYYVQFIVGKTGALEHPTLGGQISPLVDSAMLDTLRHLRLVPGRLHERPVRVALSLFPQLSGQGPPQTYPPTPPPGEAPIYADVEQLPTFANGGAILPKLREEGLNQLLLADDEQLPPHSRLVVVLVVDQDGDVRGYRVVESISPTVDAALTRSLGNLQHLVPGRHRGRPVRVALRFLIEPTGADAPLRESEAKRLEAHTRQQGQARRHPGETDAKFLRRVLPLSLAYSGHLMAQAWRPGAFGPQLFVAIQGQGDNEYGTDLLVLDPYRPHTYALQTLALGSLGDMTNLEALFLADVDHDGQRELLALKECSLRGSGFTDKHGYSLSGRSSHYATDVFRLAGTDRAGRPHYRPDTTARPYLDELPTEAAVRQALAKHAALRRKTRR